MNLKERAAQLMKDIPVVFLCLKDKQTPWLPKILAAFTVAYALSPIDLIPDFIPIIGLLDDVIILPALIALTLKLIPKEIWEKNCELAQDMWKDGKPKKWYYAIPIIVFWLLIIFIIVKNIFFRTKS